MNDAKFTPGPWVELGPYIVGGMPDQLKGPTIIMNTESLIDNPHANEALIKSAPDMYAALDAVADFLAEKDLFLAAFQVQRALRKARGESCAEAYEEEK